MKKFIKYKYIPLNNIREIPRYMYMNIIQAHNSDTVKNLKMYKPEYHNLLLKAAIFKFIRNTNAGAEIEKDFFGQLIKR
jgi:hypothetical protein